MNYRALFIWLCAFCFSIYSAGAELKGLHPDFDYTLDYFKHYSPFTDTNAAWYINPTSALYGLFEAVVAQQSFHIYIFLRCFSPVIALGKYTSYLKKCQVTYPKNRWHNKRAKKKF